uniref:GetH n=1 Tax=Streptomyces sp. ATCC 55365 TaxID=1073998 RepID=G1ECL7_9ACTN|nr:GetH [Streptomyces sp. ATCC 55365]
MSTIRRVNAYTIDHEGRTYGLSESGPLELSTGLSAWIRLVSSWVDQGQDIEQAADDLGGAHAGQARRVRDAMMSVGVLRRFDAPGEVRFVGERTDLIRAVERSAPALPDVVLGAGPLYDDWFDEVRAEAGAGRAGVVLFTEGAAVVAGPMAAEQLEEVVTALRCGDLADGRPGPDVIRTAAAQLVRRAALGSGDEWSGVMITREETSSWRALPHPWRPAPPGPAAGPFDERVMAAIDPVHGVVREIGEDDLPQVPRHLARARVAGRATVRPLDLDVVADGSDYAQARRRAVLAAVALYLESTLDPRAVVDAEGKRVVGDTADLSVLRAATDRIAADPGRWFLPARRVVDDSRLLVPVDRVRRCDESAGPSLGTAAAETRDDALATALLDVLEAWAVGATSMLVRIRDGEALPAEVREALDQLRLSDREAWLGVLPDGDVPTAVATTRHGTAYACGTSHAAAAVRAMEQAVLADQVLMHDRADLLPQTWAPPVPRAARAVDLSVAAPITLADLRRAVALRAPDAAVAELDHDAGIVRLGISAVKVVVD